MSTQARINKSEAAASTKKSNAELVCRRTFIQSLIAISIGLVIFSLQNTKNIVDNRLQRDTSDRFCER
jgi:hypothetical protein